MIIRIKQVDNPNDQSFYVLWELPGYVDPIGYVDPMGYLAPESEGMLVHAHIIKHVAFRIQRWSGGSCTMLDKVRNMIRHEYRNHPGPLEILDS